MLKVELESDGRFHSADEGATLVESQNLVSRKARSMLAQTGAQVLWDAWNAASVGCD
jgi:hypothetical protein